MKKQKRNPRKSFVDSVAQEVLAGLSEEDKEFIRNNPDPIGYHFSLGLYIRNKYIYEGYPDCESPDDLSGEIIERIIALLRK